MEISSSFTSFFFFYYLFLPTTITRTDVAGTALTERRKKLKKLLCPCQSRGELADVTLAGAIP
jgi:hypothetical protein